MLHCIYSSIYSAQEATQTPDLGIHVFVMQCKKNLLLSSFHVSACHKLVSPEEGQLPNAFVEIRTMAPPLTSWSKHAQTEIIEVSCVMLNL